MSNSYLRTGSNNRDSFFNSRKWQCSLNRTVLLLLCVLGMLAILFYFPSAEVVWAGMCQRQCPLRWRYVIVYCLSDIVKVTDCETSCPICTFIDTTRTDVHHSFSGNFFSVPLLSVLRGHSVFSSPPQRPMTSDFKGFLYQILSITLFSHLISWERASISLFNVECQTRELLVPFL